MKKDNKEVIKFPCDYKIRIFVKANTKSKDDIFAIVAKHTSKLDAKQINEKLSSKGTYKSININIIATSHLQLEKLEKDLQNHQDVLYIL